MSYFPPLLLLTVATPILYTLWNKYVISHAGARLPPGPKGYPMIGNIYDMPPHEKAWFEYAEWSKQYGDVIYMNMFGTPTIILNSLKAVSELLDKRSGNYADRPDMVMANDLMGWDWDFAHMPYSERWRQHRKIFHQYFQPRSVLAHQQVQRRATGDLLRQLVESPDRFTSHVRHHSGSTILSIVYGYKIQPENDYYVELANEAVRGLGLVVHAGSFLVDYLPFLKYIPAWVPGAGFQKIAKRWKVATNKLRNDPFEIVKKEMARVAVPSFVTENLEKMSQHSEDYISEEIIKNSAGLAYIAGSDTTVSVILTWMLAMIHYPDVFARAHAEMDSVIGKSRLPDFQDRTSLPYLEAMLSETLRWQPTTPLAIPHRASAEDIYEGYYIPKGTMLCYFSLKNNLLSMLRRRNFGTQCLVGWAIMRDNTLYPEPEKFKPERFLKQVGKQLPPDPITAGAFGYGRRICPGRYLALNTAWITIASILACFNISEPVGSDGKPFLPLIEYTGGVVVHPKPFPISLTPRSPEAVQLINSMKE
ncbi:cytochrome P450 [Cyathus striatus]|nr:cytochrome P450 [Cyathus striatus]